MADLPGVRERNFVTLSPGAIRFVGPRSKESGVFFQSPSGRPNGNLNVAEIGRHAVTLSFSKSEDGTQFGLKEVWTDTLSVNAVVFTVE